MAPLKWGIIGTGAIAQTFAHGLTQTDSGVAVAVGSRNMDTAHEFGNRFNVPNRHESYDSFLDDAEIEAVYVSTPHPFHAQWAVRAAEAGKHILCEKPLTLNHGQGMAVVEAARESGVFLMEAFMYRCHPQTRKLVDLVRRGTIGEIRLIRASFGYGGGTTIDPDSRTMDKRLGGGAILDVGCYPVSMARLLAGAAVGHPFANPVQVSGAGHLGETGADEWAAAVLRFESGIVAQVVTAVRASPDNSLEITGSSGRIVVPNPWVAGRSEPERGRIIVLANGTEEIIEVAADRTSFAYEAEVVAAAIGVGRTEPDSPAMSWADTLGNLLVLDAWRESAGLVYDEETATGNAPIRGVLSRRQDTAMTYGHIPGLDKPVSKLIMGCDNQSSFAHGAALWDDWYERGGNAFDTSFVYGSGLQERLLGGWIKSRGVRERVVVIVKGAHTPTCTPDFLVEQFHISLGRLQFDHADLYIMHRDNIYVPVGEFVDVLNGLADEGLISGAFGGSNWSLERIAAANEYAARKAKRGFAVMSSNLSLALMVKPVWSGCVHVSDSESRQWLADNDMVNLSWSSQARGYFLSEVERMKLGEENFTSWDSPENGARRKRAEELAVKRECSPLNIAAAYVLNQPFSSFALVGPRTIHETATTMPALNIELSRHEIEWLWGKG